MEEGREQSKDFRGRKLYVRVWVFVYSVWKARWIWCRDLKASGKKNPTSSIFIWSKLPNLQTSTFTATPTSLFSRYGFDFHLPTITKVYLGFTGVNEVFTHQTLLWSQQLLAFHFSDGKFEIRGHQLFLIWQERFVSELAIVFVSL